MEQIRIVKEMRAQDERNGRTGANIRPRFMVWENVPGAFSSNKGEDFRVVLEEIAKIRDENASIPMPDKGKWTTSGCIMGDRWSIAWRVLNAQFWGVPQKRRRIALVADFGGESAPEILFVRKGLSGYLDESQQERKDPASNATRGFGADDRARVYTTSHRGFQINPLKKIANTLEASDYKDAPVVAYAIDQQGGKGMCGYCADVCPTICSDSHGTPHAVSYMNGALQSNSAHSLNGNNVVRFHYIVRRLTPLEYERLQGYPDGWTDIGEYIDSNGKKRQTSDASRYKALGNSIALPPWKWVLKRICACYERDATMASLFDGIGGFPYLWEQLNGKGTCLWASEIEEFPIAVTKVRIGE